MEDVKEGKGKAEGLAVSSPNSLISILSSGLVEVGEADFWFGYQRFILPISTGNNLPPSDPLLDCPCPSLLYSLGSL